MGRFRCWVLLLILLSSFNGMAHYKPNPEGYLVTYQPGKNWQANTIYKKQKGINQHVLYIKELYRQGKINLSASFKDDHLEVLIMMGENQEDLKKLLSKDPSVMDKVLDFKMKKIILTRVHNLMPDHHHTGH
ncbi:hypothetical protein [Pseudobacteriovorax antillogorgiicola]|uniref:YCII-related domain-containing protein n=1 Tax=Pseudobacteriovorax antillogorgiicola TaxID=1513793 RepID=A0A1Y6BR38_9BACT|nr:hypothetical protein [Pseudobacteriovorax antillogorgiicola]TCS53737.1 hypothetical protein EDD56_10746 [Pseudobacteriovorax antillogorgiicola]SMF22693.1 hypothetical protein SAMN06296036_107226 [Pseudobacteriovorax antillogorgiicola]